MAAVTQYICHMSAPIEKNESEILFTRSVKAGKRVYYIDVKQDRREQLYISITESKRVKDGDEVNRPLFEKHKIFVYQEDVENFVQAFGEVADYARKNARLTEAVPAADTPVEESPVGDTEKQFDIEF